MAVLQGIEFEGLGGCQAYEVLPYVFLIGEPVSEHLSLGDLRVLPFMPFKRVNGSQPINFQISDTDLDAVRIKLATELGLTPDSWLNADPTIQPQYLAAILAAATLRHARNDRGINMFEDARHLAIDVANAPLEISGREVEDAEIAAAFLYRSLFSGENHFYRKLTVADFEPWGIGGPTLEILKEIETQLASAYRGRNRAVAANRAKCLIPAEGDYLEWAFTREEATYLNNIRNNEAIRNIELCMAGQIIRNQKEDEADYAGELLTSGIDLLNIGESEEDVYYRWDRPWLEYMRTYSNESAEWQACTQQVGVNFEAANKGTAATALVQCLTEMIQKREFVVPIDEEWGGETESNEFGAALYYRADQADWIFDACWDPAEDPYAFEIAEPTQRHIASIFDLLYNTDSGEYSDAVAKYFTQISDFEFFLLQETWPTWIEKHFGPSWAQENISRGIALDKAKRPRAYSWPKSIFNQFGSVGFDVPRLPAHIFRLHECGEWSWSSEAEHNFVADYSFDVAIDLWKNEDLDHYLTDLSVSQAGHGINSYALTLNAKLCNALLLVQVPCGGVYMDVEESAKLWNTAMRDLEPLFDLVSGETFLEGFLKIALVYSAMRGDLRLIEIDETDSDSNDVEYSTTTTEFESFAQAVATFVSLLD